MLYQLVIFQHVFFVFGYLLIHGVSVGVAFALKRERDIQRIRTLLDLSAASYPWMTGLMWAFLLSGILATFLAGWQVRIWPWLSLVLGFVIVTLMAIFGAGIYGEARNTAGIRHNFKGKWFPPEPAKSNHEVFALLAKTNPILLTVIGYGGFAIVLWPMRAKPL